uniref:Uncharacterized protein n=1 Tax=Panagrolaimus davidi TaxID=227884 RepID=A0A914R5C3_9BILA
MIDFSTILCKFWLTEKFFMSTYYAQPSDHVSSKIPYFYRVDTKSISFADQIISYNEFLFFTSNVEKLSLYKTIVKNEDATIFPLEKIIELLPAIKDFYFYDNPGFKLITKNTAKELLKIPHFSTIEEFYMYFVPEIFDIETFYAYIKTNKYTKIKVEFSDKISEDYKIRVEQIIDEIIGTENHEYNVPRIVFQGLAEEKMHKMRSLFGYF